MKRSSQCPQKIRPSGAAACKILPHLFHYIIDRDRHAEGFAVGDLPVHHADDLPARVAQGTSGISGVQRGIGLNHSPPDRRAVDGDLRRSADGRDNALRDGPRIPRTGGISDGNGALADLHGVRISHRHNRIPASRHLQERQVIGFAFPYGSGGLLGSVIQRDRDLSCVSDDVETGDQVTVRTQKEAGPGWLSPARKPLR